MKFSVASALVVGLAAESVVGSTWFSKAVYNKWHESELERWLSDHDIPYPTPADRKDLENTVKANWESAVESPYASWDTARLQRYLSDRGQEVKKGTEKNKDQLASQVKSSWQESQGSASSAYGDVSKWIFDSWTESSLKSFADKNGIPVPQPRKRDSLLQSVRSNYQSVANTAGQSAAYPGNWLYDSWSDSDLKAWLDERGIPAPQTGKRDKMIATVRRNAYVAAKDANNYAATASKSAAGAQQSLSDAVFDAWSDSEIKAWADKNSIKVPQGSNRNELLAIARKNAAKLTGDNLSGQAASAYGAATSKAGNQYDQAAKSANSAGSSGYNQASKSAGSQYNEASKYASATATNAYAQVTSLANHYFTEAQIALGLRTNYLSDVSRSASSGYTAATAKAEL